MRNARAGHAERLGQDARTGIDIADAKRLGKNRIDTGATGKRRPVAIIDGATARCKRNDPLVLPTGAGNGCLRFV